MNFKRCKRCIMDTSCRDISFDQNGICNFCSQGLLRFRDEVLKYKNQPYILEKIAEKIRSKRRGRYDCIIGLSGGTDSSYVAHIVCNEMKLKPLAIHFDNGWNTNLAIKNIERLVSKLKIDYQTHVVDWEGFSKLQKAFLNSSVKNAEIPTDHGIMATLYKAAIKYNCKYIIGGGNCATELIMPYEWSEDAKDLRLLKSVAKSSKIKLTRSLPLMGYRDLLIYTIIRRKKFISILNYIDYDKNSAQKLLLNNYGWEKYAIKHGESLFTEFFQEIYLEKKFGIIKKKAHLSSLIVAGQLDRNSALKILQEPVDSKRLKELESYIKKKLDFSDSSYQKIFNIKDNNYPNFYSLLIKYAKLTKFIKAIVQKI